MCRFAPCAAPKYQTLRGKASKLHYLILIRCGGGANKWDADKLCLSCKLVSFRKFLGNIMLASLVHEFFDSSDYYITFYSEIKVRLLHHYHFSLIYHICRRVKFNVSVQALKI